MRIFLNAILKFSCALLTVTIASPPAHSQLNNSELRDQYERQIQMLPPLSVNTQFSTVITEDEFRSRFEFFSASRMKKVFDSSAEEREQIRQLFKLSPGENALLKFVDDQNEASFIAAQDKQRTVGHFEFFDGNLNEIRRYTPNDDLVRALQFGVEQPKLRRSNPNVWVIKEFSEKDNRASIMSESKVALSGMLPVGLFNGPIYRSLEQKFSSGFARFWEKNPSIAFLGKAKEGDVYIKQDPDDASNWIVACFEDPHESIVPLWLVEVFAREQNGLDAKFLPYISDVVAKLPQNESTLSPKEKVIHSLVLFQERTDVEEFMGYPRSIRLLGPNHWESSQAGFVVNAPLFDFRMQIRDLTIRPTDRDAMTIEDGSSYYDYDRKIGWIIGETDPPIARDRSFARSVLWLMAIAVLLIGSVWYYKRK